MKNKNNSEWFNIESDEDSDLMVMMLMDNGDWEYNRLGICEDENGLFLIDVDDTGEEYRLVNRVKNGLSVEDVCKIGVECGVFEEIEDGYSDDDKYRVKFDIEEDDEKKWDEFYKKVLKDGKWGEGYYE